MANTDDEISRQIIGNQEVHGLGIAMDARQVGTATELAMSVISPCEIGTERGATTVVTGRRAQHAQTVLFPPLLLLSVESIGCLLTAPPP